MAGCCNIDQGAKLQRKTLITVLLLNLFAFFVQIVAARLGHSTALFADAFDMLGDVLAYALTLYAVNRSATWQQRATLFKGGLIVLFGIIILLEATHRLFISSSMPHSTIMSIFAVFGLAVNGLCLYLLTRHRDSNNNMRSVWICARNDIIGNCSVLLAAGLVALTHARWPDIIIGLALAMVLLYSGSKIIKN